MFQYFAPDARESLRRAVELAGPGPVTTGHYLVAVFDVYYSIASRALEWLEFQRPDLVPTREDGEAGQLSLQLKQLLGRAHYDGDSALDNVDLVMAAFDFEESDAGQLLKAVDFEQFAELSIKLQLGEGIDFGEDHGGGRPPEPDERKLILSNLVANLLALQTEFLSAQLLDEVSSLSPRGRRQARQACQQAEVHLAELLECFAEVAPARERFPQAQTLGTRLAMVDDVLLRRQAFATSATARAGAEGLCRAGLRLLDALDLDDS